MNSTNRIRIKRLKVFRVNILMEFKQPHADGYGVKDILYIAHKMKTE